MSNSYMVSIVIPVFNAAATLQRTIESVLSQTHKSIEVLIIDDWSSDQSVVIAEAYAAKDARVKLLRTSCNSGGPARPRNLGVVQSNGDFIAFCDSDDVWHPEKIEIQLRAIERYGVDVLGSKTLTFADTDSLAFGSFSGSDIAVEFQSLRMMQRRNRLSNSSVLMTKVAAITVGEFNEDRDFVAIEDYDLWLRCLWPAKMRIGIIRLPLTYYLRRTDSISSNKLMMFRKFIRVHRHFNARSKHQPGHGVLVSVSCYVLLSIYRLCLDRIIQTLRVLTP